MNLLNSIRFLTKAGLLSKTGLLKSLPLNCKGIYACKWVNNNYKGPIFQLRRTNDNVTTTFYADSTGKQIGTLPGGYGVLLTTWLGVNNASIVTWYDQSGLGNDASQSSTGNQPVLNITNGVLSIYFSTNTFLQIANNSLSAGNNSYSVSYQITDTTRLGSYNMVFSSGSTTAVYNQLQIGINQAAVYNIFNGNTSNCSAAVNLSNNDTITCGYNKTSRYIYRNGSLVYTLSTDNNLNLVIGYTYIGRYTYNNNGYDLNANLSFVSVFQDSLTDSNRDTIESIGNIGSGLLSNIPTDCQGLYACKWVNNSYTGPIVRLRKSTDTTGASPVDFYIDSKGVRMGQSLGGFGTSLTSWLSGATAYVVTWYDQTGLGNHATQSTIASQPYITTKNGYYNIYFTLSTPLNLNNYNIISSGNNAYSVTYQITDFSRLTTAYYDVFFTGTGSQNNSIEISIQLLSGSTYRLGNNFNNNASNSDVIENTSNNDVFTYNYDTSLREIYKNGTRIGYVATNTLNLIPTSNCKIGLLDANLSFVSISNTNQPNKTLIEGIGGGLLSSIPANCTALYACKWVNNAYTGPIFQIRRSSDNVVSNFYINSTGTMIGTSLGGYGTSLSTWLGVATAYVVIWYDQSGTGNHATQPTTSNQATMTVYSSMNIINFGASNSFSLPSSLISSGKSNYTISYNFINAVLPTTQNWFYTIGTNTQDNGLIGSLSTTIVSNDFPNNGFNLGVSLSGSNTFYVTNTYNASVGTNGTKYIYFNKPAANTPSATQSPVRPLNLIQLLGSITPSFGKLGYFIVFNDCISETNRAIIESIYS
jgi:hypothetical protein